MADNTLKKNTEKSKAPTIFKPIDKAMEDLCNELLIHPIILLEIIALLLVMRVNQLLQDFSSLDRYLLNIYPHH